MEIINYIKDKLVQHKNRKNNVIILQPPLKRYTVSTIFPNKEIMEDALKNL